MKKLYIKPLVEIAEGVIQSQLMDGSNFFHGEAKGDTFFENDEDEESIKSQSLWDE